MKKGNEYTGTVEYIKFANKGVVSVPTDDGGSETCIVKNVVPGQKIRFCVNKKRNGHCEGFVTEVIERSPLEIASPCPHFDHCGGCTYQNLPYDEQLKIKEEQVHALLEPVLEQIDIISPDDDELVNISSLFEPIVPSPAQFEYRNKMEFSFGDSCFGGELELGLHKRGSFYDIVTVKECRIVDKDYRRILSETLAYFRGKDTPYYHKRNHEGFLRYLLVRKGVKTGEILIDLVTTSQMPADTICTEVSLLDDWKEAMLSLKLSGSIAGILHTIDDRVADIVADDGTRVLYGTDHFNEDVLGLSFKITPFSFFQTNTLSAEVLYNKVREYVRTALSDCNSSCLENDDSIHAPVIFDLYSGTGTIGQLMSTVADKVVGVEIIEEAVKAANENAKTNGLHNCRFVSGDVLQVLGDLPEKPDLIILDPPRDGINPKALSRIMEYGVKYIVYVSCKPTSLARDLQLLISKGYRPLRICPIDQFPQTVHVETVVLLGDKRVDGHIKLDVDVENLDNTGGRATYAEIKDYIKEKYGFSIASSFIAQLKDKLGLDKRLNYHIGSGKTKTAMCPPEKEEAIEDAFRHFQMI